MVPAPIVEDIKKVVNEDMNWDFGGEGNATSEQPSVGQVAQDTLEGAAAGILADAGAADMAAGAYQPINIAARAGQSANTSAGANLADGANLAPNIAARANQVANIAAGLGADQAANIVAGADHTANSAPTVLLRQMTLLVLLLRPSWRGGQKNTIPLNNSWTPF